MTMRLTLTVSSEEEERYIDIIDGILATANLETISRKKIREGLETALGGKDLSNQKVSDIAQGFIKHGIDWLDRPPLNS